MKQEIFKCLVISGSMLLVACAGAGKESSSSSATPTIPTGSKPTTSRVPLLETKAPSAHEIDPSIKGHFWTLNPLTDRTYSESTETGRTSSLNKVVINGWTHTFAPADYEDSQSINIRSENVKRFGSGKELSYMRYGYTQTGGASPPYMFAQGKVTGNDMPKTGTAVYNGHATHISNGRMSRATATFDVDYGTREVFGTITPSSGQEVYLYAEIKGNGFAGRNWLEEQKLTLMETKGYFYGPNAEEMGGIYRGGGAINGAFGAIKK